MKSFIYLYTEKFLKGYVEYTVVLYRVKRNRIVYIGARSASYVSEAQLVLQVLGDFKVLPKAAFLCESLWSLEDRGFAHVERV